MKKLLNPLSIPDNSEDALFTPTDAGYDYFPFAERGRGYVVPTDQKPRVQAEARRAAWFFTNPQVSIFYYGLIAIFFTAWLGLEHLVLAALVTAAIFGAYLAIGLVFRSALLHRSVTGLAPSSRAFDPSQRQRMFDQAETADPPRPNFRRRWAIYALGIVAILSILVLRSDAADRASTLFVGLPYLLVFFGLIDLISMMASWLLDKKLRKPS